MQIYADSFLRRFVFWGFILFKCELNMEVANGKCTPEADVLHRFFIPSTETTPLFAQDCQ